MTKPLATDTVLRICAAYETRAASLRDLGREFSVSHETIRNILKRRGVKINPPYVPLRREVTA